MPTGCSSSKRQSDSDGQNRKARIGYRMRMIRLLALVPFAAMLGGPFFVNRVEPTVLGMPLLLAWCAAWIVLSAVIMAIVYRFDPENRDDIS
jgi:hypothetical protein